MTQKILLACSLIVLLQKSPYSQQVQQVQKVKKVQMQKAAPSTKAPLQKNFSKIVQLQIPDKIDPLLFKNPASSYGIRCWWWWLNGNVTKESILRDLKEMKAKGFSGACIFDAGGADQRGNAQVPEGPMFGSPAWRELYLYAIQEADKLGLVMSLNIQSGWNLGGPDITAEESAKQVVFSETITDGGKTVSIELPQPKSRDNFYRDIMVLAVPFKERSRLPIRDFENKAATREVGWSVPETRPLLTDTIATAGEEDAKAKQVIDISSFYKNNKLNWKAPAGKWRIIRFGFTPTDAHTSTTSGKWQGHVIDYLSEKAFTRYWETHVEPLLKLIGPMAGKTLKYLQTDSFEGGGMNWSDEFAAEFKRRRGYDLTPFMPVLAGAIVDDRSASNRFLADLRKTLGDLIAEKHYGTFAKKAAAWGIGIQPESAGPHAGPFDGLKNYAYSELMMSEFWSPSPHRSKDIDRFFVKQAGSAAKIFDKKLVGAESFTTIGPHWNDVIWADMKPSVDHEFCAGLNLTYLHTFTNSPKEMGLPGQEYFAGSHFNPNVTWWDQSTGFINYLTRCQYMLQQGRSYADVLFYYGDHVPNLGRYKQDDPAGALPGYDYDLINEDRLLDITVTNNRIQLPHGVSYRVLVIPDHRTLSLAVLKKIRDLVKQGATVLGSKPLTTASLVGFPQSEAMLKTIADELWGGADAASGSGVNRVGKGRVIWGKTAARVLQDDKLPADFAVTKKDTGLVFDYIHRELPGKTDYYFVSSQNKRSTSVQCSFRNIGKQPELWDPVTGISRPLPYFTQEDGLTTIDLQFDPYGSAFVVFRNPVEVRGRELSSKGNNDGNNDGNNERNSHNNNHNNNPNNHPTKRNNYPSYSELMQLNGSWQLSFDTAWGGPASAQFDTLQSWTERSEAGIRFFSGKAVYHKTFDLPTAASPLNKSVGKLAYFIELGDIKDVGIAAVRINGKDLGITWSPPFRLAIDDVLKPTGNKIEILVVNSWRNRLVGDRDGSAGKKLTKTNITIKPEWRLLPSGLFGPVKIVAENW